MLLFFSAIKHEIRLKIRYKQLSAFNIGSYIFKVTWIWLGTLSIGKSRMSPPSLWTRVPPSICTDKAVNLEKSSKGVFWRKNVQDPKKSCTKISSLPWIEAKLAWRVSWKSWPWPRFVIRMIRIRTPSGDLLRGGRKEAKGMISGVAGPQLWMDLLQNSHAHC